MSDEESDVQVTHSVGGQEWMQHETGVMGQVPPLIDLLID